MHPTCVTRFHQHVFAPQAEWETWGVWAGLGDLRQGCVVSMPTGSEAGKTLFNVLTGDACLWSKDTCECVDVTQLHSGRDATLMHMLRSVQFLNLQETKWSSRHRKKKAERLYDAWPSCYTSSIPPVVLSHQQVCVCVWLTSSSQQLDHTHTHTVKIHKVIHVSLVL